nr:MAG TPA: hypothetical protein [Caudoviricetes sp.]
MHLYTSIIFSIVNRFTKNIFSNDKLKYFSGPLNGPLLKIFNE